jgi:hypothetical protein
MRRTIVREREAGRQLSVDLVTSQADSIRLPVPLERAEVEGEELVDNGDDGVGDVGGDVETPMNESRRSPSSNCQTEMRSRSRRPRHPSPQRDSRSRRGRRRSRPSSEFEERVRIY